MNSNIHIRPIKKKDNKKIATMIRTVLEEFKVPKQGTAYADPHLDTLFETYTQDRSAYFILEKEGEIIGGAGIMPLEESDHNSCELQKMYLTSSVRGIGLGAIMMKKCLNFAKNNEFDQCYLETLPYMKAAQVLYKKAGFRPLEKRIGNTGHFSCNVWMLKDV
ncbi:MAG: GNAT family N-acetyltransferase [Flavobacteriaceae bacterium]|nr:GNAT family N-acetyltransferase [Flavobacteriaceae bacterium]